MGVFGVSFFSFSYSKVSYGQPHITQSALGRRAVSGDGGVDGNCVDNKVMMVTWVDGCLTSFFYSPPPYFSIFSNNLGSTWVSYTWFLEFFPRSSLLTVSVPMGTDVCT